MDFSVPNAWSLLPPIVAIALAIITRRVLISLGAGILVGILLLNGGDILASIGHLGTAGLSLFWEAGESGQAGSINHGKVDIMLFLLLLGVITSMVTLLGGAKAFGRWARQRVKSGQGAQLATFLLGIIVFIDDYFNSLAVGSTSRPLTDQHKVSRAKLAYLIDSTAAPVVVITPISSWGAYIIALIGSVLAAHELTSEAPLTAFVTMIPMNLYAIFALFMVLAVIYFKLDIGSMKRHEMMAVEGQLYDPARGTPAGTVSFNNEREGKVYQLVLPIVSLIFATLFFVWFTGYQALVADNLPITVLGAFENCDPAGAMLYGGLVGTVITLAIAVKERLTGKEILMGIVQGCQSMLSAIIILIFAWVLTGLIKELSTGLYLSSLVESWLSPQLLPVILFVVSGAMAFATGTSWGTFGIMLPIAGDMAAAIEISLMLPALAAVLAGSVFGDHCSPISDTTILSSTGAGCHHIDHVMTQLPYSLAVALVASCGFIAMGVADSVIAGLLVSSIAFVAVVIGLKWLASRKNTGDSLQAITS
ncbi:Na+/H+ antiporter NhaC family protein [Spartinivicinus poritis]|uniref:Na+/H+ antiporter NhaC family protein n=1 Tax=Spartinivicinus poritis TaxID=2994640 RepID=A0ABT5U295_9GAMM|nr:Na+/H+ antiporter NhaC family protein [Spartinivicinus sp. A2-2]MDE1460492.1 Na+/H+ antiporter NhaC family protein [Spartinivicinus sp. A2-2]